MIFIENHQIKESCEKRKKMAALQRAYYHRNKNDPNFIKKRYESSKKWHLKTHDRILLKHAKIRAKYRNLEFNLDLSDIVIPQNCPVLGLKLIPHSSKTRRPSPCSPSLDRIDHSKGYIKGNVRIISHRANLLKSNATIEELRLILKDLENI